MKNPIYYKWRKLFMARKIAVFILIIATALTANAQVTVDATLDSTQIFIGQRVGITLEVSANKDNVISLPEYDSLQQIVSGVEFVSASGVDTTFLNEGNRMVLRRRYYITSFDSSLYYLPPMKVICDTTSYNSKSLALKVYTFDVDTAHVDSIFPLNDVFEPPFAIDDWKSVIYMALGIMLLILALVFVVLSLKDNKPILKRIRLAKRQIPHKVAMEKIERIQADELSKTDDSKLYYTQLTDTLRQYITDRFGFNAMEMTTSEIVTALYASEDTAGIEELHELFLTADLVKFAKYKTEISENDRNLLTAIDYINQTKKEEVVTPQPEEIVVEDKGSKYSKLIKVILTVLLSLGLFTLLAFLVNRLILNLI